MTPKDIYELNDHIAGTEVVLMEDLYKEIKLKPEIKTISSHLCMPIVRSLFQFMEAISSLRCFKGS